MVRDGSRQRAWPMTRAGTPATVAITGLFAGPPERNLLQDRDIVLDHGRLAYDQSSGMIEEDSASDAHRRINVGLEDRRRAALQIVSEILAASVPQPVSKPVRLNRVKAFEVKHRLEEAVGRRIAIDCRDNIRTERLAHRRLGLEGVGVGLTDHLSRDLGAVEPLGHAVNDRSLQRIVVQDGGIDQCRQLGLAAHNLFGLAANTRPNRVDLIERSGSDLTLGHARLRHPLPRPA
jgi:hypothetical protein